MHTSAASETNGFYDEMLGANRVPRAGCERVVAELLAMPPGHPGRARGWA